MADMAIGFSLLLATLFFPTVLTVRGFRSTRVVGVCYFITAFMVGSILLGWFQYWLHVEPYHT